MKWIQENPFLSALIGAILIFGGGLIFFLLQAMQDYQQTNDSYTAALQKLHQLQNRTPFPSEDNLQKTKVQQEAFENEVKELQQQLTKRELPLEKDITPQKFQDDLRTIVNQIEERAKSNSVKLPENFYLGFDHYRTSLPPDEAAPALARQLAVISQVVNNLIDFKITSINNLKRLPLPEEVTNASESGDTTRQAQDQNQPRRQKDSNQRAMLSRHPFEINFTAEQGKFRIAFNSLLESDPFLIIRALSIQNTQPASPSKKTKTSADMSKSSQASPTESTTIPDVIDRGKDLLVILGREEVIVTVRIEMIDFVESNDDYEKPQRRRDAEQKGE